MSKQEVATQLKEKKTFYIGLSEGMLRAILLTVMLLT